MLEAIVKRIPWTSDFKIDEDKRIVELQDPSGGQETSAICDAAFAKIVDTIVEQDLFEVVHGQHSELFQIPSARYPVKIERFATSLFGIVSRGAHLTAYTRSSQGMKIWVPRRNPNMKSYPNKLDTTVAGGVRADESPFEAIIHEADEEATLPAQLLRRDVRSCGALTYISTTGDADIGENDLVIPDIVYVYDIELNEDVVPKPKDDEVKEFYFMTVDEVKEALATGEFKTNCAVVMLDFFIRHGIITAENDENFVEIYQRMHRKLPFLVFKGEV